MDHQECARYKQISWAAEWYFEVLECWVYFINRKDVKESNSPLADILYPYTKNPRLISAKSELEQSYWQAHKHLKESLEGDNG